MLDSLPVNSASVAVVVANPGLPVARGVAAAVAGGGAGAAAAGTAAG